VIERHNDQILFSRQWKKISCPPFDPQTKAQEKPLGVWSEQIYQCLQRLTSPATLSAKQILPNPENLLAKVVYQKQHHLMPHVVTFVHNLVTLELHVRRDPHYFILNSILQQVATHLLTFVNQRMSPMCL
jgi:hypothetical protein